MPAIRSLINGFPPFSVTCPDQQTKSSGTRVIDRLCQLIHVAFGRSGDRHPLVEMLDPLCPLDRQFDKLLNDLSEIDGAERGGVENALEDHLVAVDVERDNRATTVPGRQIGGQHAR